MFDNSTYGTLMFLAGISVMFCFVRTYCNWPRAWDWDSDGDFEAAFLEELEMEARWTQEQKEIIRQIVRLWTHQKRGGVTLALTEDDEELNHQPSSSTRSMNTTFSATTTTTTTTFNNNNKFQMIEFLGPTKLRRLPMVEIQWAYTGRLADAQLFLKGEKTEVLDLEPNMYRHVFEHLESHSRTEELSDPMARGGVYEGHLSPRQL